MCKLSYMNTIGYRIKQARKRKDLTQQKLADAIGVSRPAVTQWELNKTKNLDAENLYKLCAALEVSQEWILYGTGSDIMKSEESNVREPPENLRIMQIPVLTWVQAGPFVESYVDVEPIEYIALPLKNTRRAYCLIVEGDSMVGPPGSDSYPPGSYIVLNPDLEPQNGSRVVAKKKGTDEATFKVFRREGSELWLRPLNPQYQAIPMTSDYVIIGVVVGTWIPRKNGDGT